LTYLIAASVVEWRLGGGGDGRRSARKKVAGGTYYEDWGAILWRDGHTGAGSTVGDKYCWMERNMCITGS